MRHRIVFLLLLISGVIPAMAQHHYYPERPADDAVRYEGPIYGIKGGINIPRLYYTSEVLRDLPHVTQLKPSVSCFVELPMTKTMTIAPELNYQQRGDSTYYRFNGSTVQYSLFAHYISVRVPVYCYIPVTDLFKPYLFLGPDLGVPVAGDIQLKSDPSIPGFGNTTKINSSNINRLYFGALGGVGMRVNVPFSIITMVLKLEAALNWGLTDTYSRAEHAGTAHPLNVQAYTINGHRYSRGLEIHLGLGFFFNKQDACGGFQ